MARVLTQRAPTFYMQLPIVYPIPPRSHDGSRPKLTALLRTPRNLNVPHPQRTLGPMAVNTAEPVHGCQRALAKREERTEEASSEPWLARASARRAAIAPAGGPAAREEKQTSSPVLNLPASHQGWPRQGGGSAQASSQTSRLANRHCP